MTEYSRAIAIELAEDLVEIADVIMESVKNAEPAAPPVDDTCRSLGAAIKSLLPILKPWPPGQIEAPARRSTAGSQISSRIKHRGAPTGETIA